MKNTSIIEEVRITDGNKTLEAQREIYPIEGGSPPKIQRDVRYNNLKTGEVYRCLAGGLSWPGARPGHAVIVVVMDFPEGGQHSYRTIDEFEDKHPRSFLKRIHMAYEKYTKSCEMIPFFWYGDDQGPKNDFATRENEKIRASDPDYVFNFTYPPYWEESNRFEMYVLQIFNLSHKSDKRLSLGDCHRIAKYLDNLDPLKAHLGKVEDHPAVSALGFVLTALEERKPWEIDHSLTYRSISTIDDDGFGRFLPGDDDDDYFSEDFDDDPPINTGE